MVYLNVTIGKRKSINRKKFSERSLSPGRGELPKKKSLIQIWQGDNPSRVEGLLSNPKKGTRSGTNKEVNLSLNKGAIRKRARYEFQNRMKRKIQVRSSKMKRIEWGREPNRV